MIMGGRERAISAYRCGTCSSGGLVIRPAPDGQAFDVFCDRGHKLVPVPGEEYVTLPAVKSLCHD